MPPRWRSFGAFSTGCSAPVLRPAGDRSYALKGTGRIPLSGDDTAALAGLAKLFLLFG